MDEKIYIDGQWVASSGRATLDVINPATEVAFTRIAAATAEDVDRAVVAARRAFDGGWKRTTGKERAAFLRGIAAHIRNRQPELARLEVEDNGKPLPEADWDVGDAAGCFEFYAGLAEELDARQGEPIAVPDDRFTSSVRLEPIGVAGADHSLELSAADGGLEGGAGARGRLHHGAEAFGADARSRRLKLARDRRRGGTAEGRAQRRHGHGRGSRRRR